MREYIFSNRSFRIKWDCKAALYLGDQHCGSKYTKFMAQYGVQELEKMDKTIAFIRELGDALQGNNYKGSETEGVWDLLGWINNLQIILQQFRRYFGCCWKINCTATLFICWWNHSDPEKSKRH